MYNLCFLSQPVHLEVINESYMHNVPKGKQFQNILIFIDITIGLYFLIKVQVLFLSIYSRFNWHGENSITFRTWKWVLVNTKQLFSGVEVNNGRIFVE